MRLELKQRPRGKLCFFPVSSCIRVAGGETYNGDCTESKVSEYGFDMTLCLPCGQCKLLRPSECQFRHVCDSPQTKERKNGIPRRCFLMRNGDRRPRNMVKGSKERDTAEN